MFSDGLDTLDALAFTSFDFEPSAVAPMRRVAVGIEDRAWYAAAGACGTDQVVCFRDPQGEEDDDDDELYGFCGLYVRRLSDGTLLERIDYDAPVRVDSALCGTDDVIAVHVNDRLDIVPRAGARCVRSTAPVAACALDGLRGRVAIVDTDGRLRVASLPGAVD